MDKSKIEKYMRMAIRLAKKAEGETFPNPLVGAVIVKNGRIVGRGFHKKAGGPHAEIYALKSAGFRARGAALFCTFEPCVHYGRTGPCVDAIIQAGIKEVYAGMVDPNPLTRGKGLLWLRRHGLNVRVGFLEKDIRELNKPFVWAMINNRPLVTVKIAESIDGKAATRSGESRWITDAETRRYSHDLRRFYDGIMVGINTVLRDDPFLELSAGPATHVLRKIIVDSRLRIPLSCRLLKTKQPVIVAAVKKNRKKEALLARAGVCVIHVRSKNSRVDCKDLLEKLHTLEIRNILVEGGATLIGSLLDQKLADKIFAFIAPKIIGGKYALSSIGGQGIDSLRSAIRLENIHFKRFKDDFLVQGDLRY